MFVSYIICLNPISSSKETDILEDQPQTAVVYPEVTVLEIKTFTHLPVKIKQQLNLDIT